MQCRLDVYAVWLNQPMLLQQQFEGQVRVTRCAASCMVLEDGSPAKAELGSLGVKAEAYHVLSRAILGLAPPSYFGHLWGHRGGHVAIRCAVTTHPLDPERGTLVAGHSALFWELSRADLAGADDRGAMPDLSTCGQVSSCHQGAMMPSIAAGWPEIRFATCWGAQAVEIFAGRLTFVAVRDVRAFNECVQECDTFSIDKELVDLPNTFCRSRCGWACASPPFWISMFATVQVYYPFYKDFGPLNLGLAFRFCRKLAQLLQARSPRCVV